ncbi:MAG: sialidase family protein, partial [Rhodothermia bacterium]
MKKWFSATVFASLMLVGCSSDTSSPAAPEHVTIFASAAAYTAWPAVASTADDAILVLYTESDEHMGPDGRIMGVRSTDEGRSWAEPYVVYDTPLDDRESGITVLSDGSLVVHLWSTRHTRESYERMAPGSYLDETVEAWIDTVESPKYQNAADLEGGHVARSTDG